MNKFHHSIRRIAAVLIGIVFLVSGLLKLHDPVGTSLIVTSYLRFFHLGALAAAAGVFGAVLALTEALLGAALVTGTFRRISAVLTEVLTAVFTLVTLILLIANPEMDCGCFGEAIHLSHLQSFLKNLILLVLTGLAFVPFGSFGEPAKRKYVSFCIMALSFAVALGYNLGHLPTVDFTDFAVGNELQASLDNDYQEDDGIFFAKVYRRNGQSGSFAGNRHPDSTWTFERNDTLRHNTLAFGKRHPSLSFRDADGEYQDELAVLGKVFVFSVPEPSKLSDGAWMDLFARSEDIFASGGTPIVLTPDGDIPSYLSEYSYVADYKTLITLNRSNGGLTYIDNGFIAKKWHARDLPDSGEIASVASNDPVEVAVSYLNRGRIRASGFLLYLLALLLLL
ncbi:MAG: hypothetical protein IJR77_02455 [Bacteroidales bacterium]|nr:hypothetical protein [Bacteroidales bacterium]